MHVWRDLSRLVDVECKNCHVVDSISFSGNMPQAGLCDKKLSLVENRNHVWRDLSRLVDVECKNCHVVDSKAFSGKKM